MTAHEAMLRSTMAEATRDVSVMCEIPLSEGMLDSGA